VCAPEKVESAACGGATTGAGGGFLSYSREAQLSHGFAEVGCGRDESARVVTAGWRQRGGLGRGSRRFAKGGRSWARWWSEQSRVLCEMRRGWGRGR